MKPQKIGTIISREMVAVLKIISNTGHWSIVGYCLDTPNALKSAVKNLKKSGINNIWKKSATDIRPMPLF